MRWPSKQLVLTAGISFVLGIVCGLGGLRRFIEHRVARGQIYHTILTRLDARLHLSPEQRTQVEMILTKARRQVASLQVEVRPRFQEVRDATRKEIGQVLTPDQRQQFDRIQARWESRVAMLRARLIGP